MLHVVGMKGRRTQDLSRLAALRFADLGQNIEKSGIGHIDDVSVMDLAGLLGSDRGESERHGQTVVASGVRGPSGEPAVTQHLEAIGLLLHMTAKSTEPRGQGRDAVALLVTEFTGARDAEGATVGRERREHRQFVDGAGHVGRPDLERRQMAMSDSQGADGLVADRDAVRPGP